MATSPIRVRIEASFIPPSFERQAEDEITVAEMKGIRDAVHRAFFGDMGPALSVVADSFAPVEITFVEVAN